MKRTTPDHPKMLMLSHELKLPKYAAVGVLEALWHWTAQYAPAGDVGRYANHFIGQAIGWDGDHDQLVAALVQCRWLDEHPEHRLVVHDWRDHCDDAVHAKLSRSRLWFANGTTPKMVKLNKAEREEAEAFYQSGTPERHADLARHNGTPERHAGTARLPSPTQPSPSLPSHSPTQPSPGAAAAGSTRNGSGGGGDQSGERGGGGLGGVLRPTLAKAQRVFEINAILDRAGVDSAEVCDKIRNRRDLTPEICEAMLADVVRSNAEDVAAVVAHRLTTWSTDKLRGVLRSDRRRNGVPSTP